MQYSHKLKKATEEIKAILIKYDIAGSIVLHSPGFSEYLNHISPSYSCLKFDGDNLRIKTKGYTKEQVRDTVNMITHFGDTCGRVAMNYFELKDKLKKHMDIYEDDGRHTSHTEQNQ